MARSRVEIDPKFRRLLQQLPAQVLAPLKQAIADSGTGIYAEAVRRVPKDSGDLAHSIGMRIGSGGLSVEVGFDRKRFPKQWKLAGWRAKFIEFGTKGYSPGSKRTDPGSKTTKTIRQRVAAQPARPFLRPAFDANRKWIIERHRAALIKVIEGAGGA